MTTDPKPAEPREPVTVKSPKGPFDSSAIVVDTSGSLEHLAVLLHERFRPLAGDVLIFDDCEQIAQMAVVALKHDERAAYDRGLAKGRQEVERLTLLLEQAEQYARDLQDGGIFLHDEAVATVRQEGLAEGRRQATEGPVMLSVAANLTDDEAAELKARFQQAMQRPAVMTVLPEAVEIRQREWSVRCLPDGFILGQRFTEAGARARAEEIDGEPVSRLVGPWEPDGQDGGAENDAR